MEETARKYEHQLQETYNEIDKSHIRRIQKNVFDCSSACCDNTTASYEEIQKCVERCTTPLHTAQEYIKSEFEDFQNRVQRCLMVCNDKVKEKMEREKVKEFSGKYRTEYEECAISCLSKHKELLSMMTHRIRDTLDKNVK